MVPDAASFKFSSVVDVDMGNFYVSAKPAIDTCILTALMKQLSWQETYSKHCRNDHVSAQEEPTCVIGHFTLISLYRQCNFRVVSQWKPVPFSNELSVNKGSICTVVFNVGNM